MSRSHKYIPYYAADGTSLGSRTFETAMRLLDGGHVKPAYGRKGHLKAIFLEQPDGGNPVDAQPRTGKRYSFLERLDSGHRDWKHKKLDVRDEDGTFVSTRGAFLQVMRECMR
ncbi:MAG: hypothetical protein KIT09_31800 [Bryobacteraceae bacterium]|nr:hypothetical protein [Bryobacteraceae bacterium]